MAARLAALPATTWVRAIPIALVAAVVIAVPADLIENPVFGRPIPPKAIDYVILAITAALIGLILAIRPATESAVDLGAVDDGTVGSPRDDLDRQDNRTLWGGAVSFLAVGCPVCNQAVVALVGTSGALSWWAPIQPVVGLVAVGLLLYTLRLRLRTYALAACPIPNR